MEYLIKALKWSYINYLQAYFKPLFKAFQPVI